MSNTSILIKGGTIIDPDNDLNRTTADILIENGVIQKISESELSVESAEVIDAKGCFILPGMLDLRCQLKDPGYEHQEDIFTGTAAAAASGFTALAVQPTTNPITQNKSQIEYLAKRGEECLPDLLPLGATTQNAADEDITEMFDMRSAGAVGFSNGDNAYPSTGVLMRALLYSKEFGGLVMSHALDVDLSKTAFVNESSTTIHTGLKQQPDLAETIQLKKEIDIAAYADAHIHFSHISSAKGVEIIREAKKDGIKVTCDVSIWHLIYSDDAVLEYDTNFKVTPPFRATSDKQALIAGVLDGTIDAIVSDHNPQNIENKQVEFDYASYGINGFQTFYSVYDEFLSETISLEEFVKKTCHSPRSLLNQSVTRIQEGQKANLWVANPTRNWTLDKSTNLSRSENNPLFGRELKGRCDFVINGKSHKNYTSN